MLLTIMLEMAALTKSLQIARPVVGGIVIQMRGRKDNAGLSESPLVLRKVDKGDRPPLSVPPAFGLGIKPAAIAQMADQRMQSFGDHGAGRKARTGLWPAQTGSPG